ncbi:MAG: DUF362 domain-containing protein [Lachnospiraceae bacterium]
MKGTDDIDVPVVGGEYVKSAKIGRAVMDADVFISLTHFKGHEMTGFGGAIKNIGMGCGSRAGKTEQHCSGKPHIDEALCRGCSRCQRECANGGLVFDKETRKMHVNQDNCVGCGRCLGACNFDAISFDNNNANELSTGPYGRVHQGSCRRSPNFHISLIVDVSPNCDCHGENDVPILPQSHVRFIDPLALDQALRGCRTKASPMPGSQLDRHMSEPHFHDHHDPFRNSTPESEWRSCLEHAEKIGLGSRDYELIDCRQGH